MNEVWFSAVSKDISLDKVPFGLRLGRAQMRLLLQQQVLEVIDSLQETPPLSLVRDIVWEHTGERKVFVIGGGGNIGVASCSC